MAMQRLANSAAPMFATVGLKIAKLVAHTFGGAGYPTPCLAQERRNRPVPR